MGRTSRVTSRAASTSRRASASARGVTPWRAARSCLGQTETVTPGNVTPTFGVHDIDVAIAHLREHDVQVEDWHEIDGTVRLSTFYDPDGTSWMLAQTLDRKDERG